MCTYSENSQELNYKDTSQQDSKTLVVSLFLTSGHHVQAWTVTWEKTDVHTAGISKYTKLS